ncbi:hypothetical protein [Rheinheimera aquimaris]|uniref:hypothetical protein n=1 Tax=Rheinheimera aquimaris TaxID=412437 RepID=UPI003A97DF64
MHQIQVITSLWREGFYSSEEVVTWADRKILELDDLPEALMELSLKGPERCLKKPIYEFPQPLNLDFVQRFSLKVVKLSLESDKEVEDFIRWASVEAMGEDINLPEVYFCYYLEDIWQDEGNMLPPKNYLKKQWPQILEQSNVVVSELTNQCT